MNVYRKVFHDFILEIVDESNFAAYSGHPDNDGQSDIPTNQLCRTSRQIRLESIPVLASCTKVIVAPILLPYKDGHIDTSIKPQLVYPKLNKAFRSNIQAIFVSLQSAWIPHHRDYSNLRRVVVDAWLSGEEPIKVVKDKDLSKMASRDLVGYGGSEDIHPRWLEELVEEKSSSVKLALRQVWKLDEDTSDSSHLVRPAPVSHCEQC